MTQITVNDDAQIDVATARRNDCLVKPLRGSARYLLIAGGDEPAGWIEQSQLYADTVVVAGHPCEFNALKDTDHFTVGCESFIATSKTFSKIRALL